MAALTQARPATVLPRLSPTPGSVLDHQWFHGHPHRAFAVFLSEGVAHVCHIDRSTSGLLCRFPSPGASLISTESEAAALFDTAAVEWIARLGTRPTAAADLAWFQRRPSMRARLRPADPAELIGRPAGVWVTLVYRTRRGFGHLCLDERTLGRGERSDAGLIKLLVTRCRALALGVVAEKRVDYLPALQNRPKYRTVKSGRSALPLTSGRKDVSQARAAIRRLTGRPEPVARAKPVPRMAPEPSALPKSVAVRSTRNAPSFRQEAYVVAPCQCRAARAWLDWSQRDLAAYADVSFATVQTLERGDRNLRRSTIQAIQEAFEEYGIIFAFDDEGRAIGIGGPALAPPGRAQFA
jgi:DNA-binding XRE family transcriptional regulator